MSLNNTLLITGGAGFIGSRFILNHLQQQNITKIINLDKLTYAANLQNLSEIQNHPNYQFIQGDIGDQQLVFDLLTKHRPQAIINFSAETHVDRSIYSPQIFIDTNITAIFHLLETTLNYWEKCNKPKDFRFIHISTDEVYGSLSPRDLAFTETSPYAPNNPYSASKASGDHLTRAYYKTYGLPIIKIHPSNNYGPHQHQEKLIPQSILNALNNKTIPIYGQGEQIRDWLYVDDHCLAIQKILQKGKIGESYNVGGQNEHRNLDVINLICDILDTMHPKKDTYKKQIVFVQDRLGHDERYAINPTKIKNELAWRAEQNFKEGLQKTIRWFLEHQK